MSGPITNQPQASAAQPNYFQAAMVAMESQAVAAPAQQPAARDSVSRSAPTGAAPASAVNLSAPAAPAAPQAPAQGGQPELFLTDRNQIVTADGQPYLGVEMYLREDGQITNPQGQVIDPNTLPGAQAPATGAPTAADQTLVRRIKTGTAIASGAMGVGMDYMWYRSTLGGMERRLASAQRTSTAFQAGQGLQGRLATAPVVGRVVNGLENRRQGQMESLSRNIRVARMTPAQEGTFLARERLTALRTESRAFRQGEGLMGRMKDTPVVGRVANGLENRRQATIRTLQTQIKAGEAGASTWTRVRNATRGRIFPAIMLASDGYSVYNGVRHLNDAGNTRQWDDALRIGGNAVSAVGDVLAFRRGHIGTAVATHAAGLVVNTLGTIFNDQD